VSVKYLFASEGPFLVAVTDLHGTDRRRQKLLELVVLGGVLRYVGAILYFELSRDEFGCEPHAGFDAAGLAVEARELLVDVYW